MKKLSFLLLILIAASWYGCRKSAPTLTYRGVILMSVCSHQVIQTLGPNYLGVDNWTLNNSVYHHVFNAQNYCQMGSYKVGDTINFQIIATQVNNCFYCMELSPTTGVYYPVGVVK